MKYLKLSSSTICLLSFVLITTSYADPIDHNLVTYTYPGQPPASGPGLSPNILDPSNSTLSDGVIPGDTIFTSGEWVGFNEDPVFPGTTLDDGTPQPRIDFDLGGIFNLTAIDISYLYGGGFGVAAPDSLEVRFSTDGGISFSSLADIVFTGFNPANNPFGGSSSIFQDLVTIDLAFNGITDVRMDFFQGNQPANFSTPYSEWVFLGEITFYDDTSSVPEPATLVLMSLGLASLGFSRRKKLNN